jgi:hypothetical protein
MKTTVTTLTVCISLILICTFTLKSSAKIDPKTIVGEWHFDEGSGKTAKDTSGNGNDGKLMNDPIWVNGKVGKALAFDGKDDFVDMSDITLDSSAITITAWIKGPFGGTGDEAVAYGGGDVGGSFILRTPGGNAIQVWVSNGAAAYFFASPEATISPEGWYHIAATAEGNEFKIYIGGVLKAEGSQAGYEVAKSESFMVGKTRNRDRSFKGTIDEVALFSVALTKGDINSIATAAVSPKGNLTTTWGRLK